MDVLTVYLGEKRRITVDFSNDLPADAVLASATAEALAPASSTDAATMRPILSDISVDSSGKLVSLTLATELSDSDPARGRSTIQVRGAVTAGGLRYYGVFDTIVI